MTSEKGVFVAGDMTRGPSLVVHAISEGMQAASKIIEYLKNQNTGTMGVQALLSKLGEG